MQFNTLNIIKRSCFIVFVFLFTGLLNVIKAQVEPPEVNKPKAGLKQK